MAADWIGITSAHYVLHCGDDGLNTIEEALDGTDQWYHGTDETHWFFIDLGEEYNVQKVRGRSNGNDDPIDVNIYVSNDPDNWGAAVASGVDFSNTASPAWVEVDTTDKDGRYVMVEIEDTEDASKILEFGGEPTFTIFDVYGEATAAPPAADVAVIMGANF